MNNLLAPYFDIFKPTLLCSMQQLWYVQTFIFIAYKTI